MIVLRSGSNGKHWPQVDFEYFHLLRQKKKQNKLGAKRKKDEDKNKEDGKFSFFHLCVHEY